MLGPGVLSSLWSPHAFHPTRLGPPPTGCSARGSGVWAPGGGAPGLRRANRGIRGSLELPAPGVQRAVLWATALALKTHLEPSSFCGSHPERLLRGQGGSRGSDRNLTFSPVTMDRADWNLGANSRDFQETDVCFSSPNTHRELRKPQRRRLLGFIFQRSTFQVCTRTATNGIQPLHVHGSQESKQNHEAGSLPSPNPRHLQATCALLGSSSLWPPLRKHLLSAHSNLGARNSRGRMVRQTVSVLGDFYLVPSLLQGSPPLCRVP